MTTTVAQAHRHLVAEMDEAGDSPAEIAKKLGISIGRVEAILDQLDESDGRPAHPDDEYRAPAVEPVRPEPRPVDQSGPIVVGSPARAPKKKPAVEVRPVPEMPSGADELTTEDLVMTDQQHADIEALRAELAAPPRCGEKQGTYAGYQWHRQNDHMPPCDPCAEARRQYDRDYAEKRREQAPPKPPPTPRGVREHGTAKGARQHWGHKEPLCDPCREAYNAEHRKSPEPAKRTGPAPCGTQAAYKRHLRHDEKPCDPCIDAHSVYMQAYRDKPQLDRPEGAVAHLSLPLTVPALVAVTDALELAYGPGLRVAPADGGLWVLGRAS